MKYAVVLTMLLGLAMAIPVLEGQHGDMELDKRDGILVERLVIDFFADKDGIFRIK
ncbi:hypothetical protein CDV31_016898 [Fusarium ambrosium]|uniref:Uncharacterized protein n=1 Tax=Fusarium ambrosium TaxID=131363 RepID=A0A428RZ19_9HYPO|nr:hypothetical protein CDV31_016898 [Fusarium ambrosium]